MYEDVLNPPIEACDDGYWVIAPKLNPVRMKEVAEDFGVTLKELKFWLNAIGDQKDPYKWMLAAAKEVDWDSLEDIPKLSTLNTLVKDTDLVVGDWMRASSWGKDPETGAVRVIDWGLTEATLMLYRGPVGMERN
jgi:hypothetical protein